LLILVHISKNQIKMGPKLGLIFRTSNFWEKYWCELKKTVQLISEHFRVLGFLQSLMEMVIFEVFVFAFMKDIRNGSPISCEFFLRML